jgi:hypothetical protein
MIALIRLLLCLLVTPFRSKTALEAENAALRQQIVVLRRKLRGRVKFSNADRLFFVWLYRLFPSISRVMVIIRPETPVRWLCVPIMSLSLPKTHPRTLCVPKKSSGLTR